MPIPLIVAIAILIPVAVLFALWLFLIAPRKRGAAMEPFRCPYAHRGLWGGDVPENSLAAFRAAADAGFGIELDVQLSKDGEVMVFHDYTLDRVCGVSGKVIDHTASELGNIPLNGVENECIPTLQQVLDAVGGRVPLLIELKGESGDAALVPRVLEVLQGYDGKWCMESFNPMLVMTVRKQMPDILCGLLYTNVCRDKKKRSALNIALTAMALNFIARPDFIAYNKEDRDSLPVRITTGLYGAPKVVWTIKTREELDTAHANGELPIFENIF